MRKPMKPRAQPFADINFKNHWLVGFVWPMRSARTGEMYNVEMTPKGMTCDCQAGTIRGKCKHAQEVHDRLVKEDPLPVDRF
jgi:hypothetical protein